MGQHDIGVGNGRKADFREQKAEAPDDVAQGCAEFCLWEFGFDNAYLPGMVFSIIAREKPIVNGCFVNDTYWLQIACAFDTIQRRGRACELLGFI